MARLVTVSARVTHRVHVQFEISDAEMRQGSMPLANRVTKAIEDEAKASARMGRFFDAEVGNIEIAWREA